MWYHMIIIVLFHFIFLILNMLHIKYMLMYESCWLFVQVVMHDLQTVQLSIFNHTKSLFIYEYEY